MKLVKATVLSLAVCFICKGYISVLAGRDKLKLSPFDLELVVGEMMSINCSLCRLLRSRYNASDIAFNFTMSRTNKLPGSSSAEDEICNEKPVLTSEEFLETGNETDVCNATQEEDDENEDDLLGYEDPDVFTFRLSTKDIRIIDRFRAELRHPLVDEKFNNGVLTCYLDPDPTVKAEAHVLVGERPRVPVITDAVVRNWRRIEFSWKTIGSAKYDIYSAEYKAWFRNNTSEKFTECRLQPKTTPPPNFSEELGIWKRCLTFCVADIELSFPHDPINSVFVLKVTGSNAVGRVSSEKIVNLYDILNPDPVRDLSVRVMNVSVCVTFRSPQRDATLDYELLFNCNSKIYETILSALKVEFVDRCISNLPSYSACVLSVRAKPHGYGNWSEPSGHKEFKTAERVPLAAPEVCHSCFEVSPLMKSGDFLVKIFFKPLPHELARGRIDKYRLLVRGYDSKYKMFEPQSSTLEVDGLDSSSSIYDFSLTASTTVGYNESVIPQPLTLNPFRSYELKNKIRNVTAFILNSTTVRLSWSCLEPSDGKNFFVFWCRGDIACKSEIHSLRVPPGANQQAITVVPSMELVNFLYGVAFETRDGHSSGISWSQCLHNLSQVCLPPKLDKELIGESLRLKFHLDNICNGGYPYAFNLSYCSLVAGNESRNCRDTPVVIVVNSSYSVYEIGQLPAPDRHYLFVASSLTVAGPSLSPSEMIILSPPINPSINPLDKRVFLVFLLAVPMFAALWLFYHCKRKFPRIRIAFPPPVIEVEPVHSVDDAFDQILPYAGCSVTPITVSSSSGHSSTGSLVRNGDTVSSTHPLLGYRNPISSTGSNPYCPSDSESHDGSGGNGAGDTSAVSAGSVYRAVGSLTIKVPDELMTSPPVTDLKYVEEEEEEEEDVSLECVSVVGSDQRTFGNTDSDYAFGRLADTSQAGSRRSLGSSDVNNSAVQQIEVQPSLNCEVIFLPVSDKGTDGEIGNIILSDTNLNDSDENGDDDDDDDDNDDDDPYRCSSDGYATTRLCDKAAEPFLDTVASKPIMSLDSSSDDDDDDSSSSCPYAAVTFCDKPVLNPSIDLAKILNTS